MKGIIGRTDGDCIRAIGFVVVYGAHLENEINNLLKLLQAAQGRKSWAVSEKIKRAKKFVRSIDDKHQLLLDLDKCSELFNQRNELVHGLLYSTLTSKNNLKSTRPNESDKAISAEEIYHLAEKIFSARSRIHRPQIFDLAARLKTLRLILWA